MTSRQIRIYPDADAVAAEFARDFFVWSQRRLQQHNHLTVALSGGSTPQRLFEIWGRKFPGQTPEWNRIHFFWGDERCVPPTDRESNFGVAQQLWLSKVEIASSNIHRILGENEPEREQVRYAAEISRFAGSVDGNSRRPPATANLPQFDLVILGMGNDGHIASIFPDRLDLFETTDVCAVATHPITGQRRITLTGPTILAADRIVFLITGSDKASILKRIIDQHANYEQYPASRIVGRKVEFFLDEMAASQL